MSRPTWLGKRQRISATATLVGATIAAAVAVPLAANTPASAVVIRQAEWPLDASHFGAQQIWRITQGQGVTVAVIDSGVDATHPDLTGQVLAGTGLLGDKHDNGQTDISSDSHGTAIAGIIAGTGIAQDGYGMIGLAPKAKILPIRVATGSAVEATTLAEGIKYASDHQTQVINISMGTATPDPILRQAVNYALNKGAVVVASAGNDGQNGNPLMYPAAFPGVIDVTGVDSQGQFWPVSESGPQSTLAAPATNIYSTNDRGQYVNAAGTSYATAYVSAAAALLRSAYPHLTAGQTIRRLVDTAQQPAGHTGHDNQYGYGILDPLAALRAPTTINGDPTNPLLSPQPLGTAPQSHLALWSGLGTSALAAAALAWVLLARHRNRAMGVKAQPATPRQTTGNKTSAKKPSTKKHKPRISRK